MQSGIFSICLGVSWVGVAITLTRFALFYAFAFDIWYEGVIAVCRLSHWHISKITLGLDREKTIKKRFRPKWIMIFVDISNAAKLIKSRDIHSGKHLFLNEIFQHKWHFFHHFFMHTSRFTHDNFILKIYIVVNACDKGQSRNNIFVVTFNYANKNHPASICDERWKYFTNQFKYIEPCMPHKC